LYRFQIDFFWALLMNKGSVISFSYQNGIYLGYKIGFQMEIFNLGTNLISLEIQPVKIDIELHRIEKFRYYRFEIEIEVTNFKNRFCENRFRYQKKNFDSIYFDFGIDNFLNIDHVWSA
jgi:hypothetical protein